MRGLQVMAGFTLYPDRALIEITGKIFNGNATPRHFLWWANPAVKAAMPTRVYSHPMSPLYSTMVSVMFPLSRLPPVPTTKWTILRGLISPVIKRPGTHFVYGGEVGLRFVGAYHHDERGGLLHVADHHVSPGKKQWSWGTGIWPGLGSKSD